MTAQKRVRWTAALLLTLLISFSSPAAALQEKSEKGRELPQGSVVLWREPADIAARDLFLGPGGKAMQPDLRSLTFIEQEQGGFSTKYRVRDAAGREWVAKIGKEAQAETAAVRLVWAVGYLTEINYLVPCVRIGGAPYDRKKHRGTCDEGEFENVRLEARPQRVKRLDEWKWKRNPFAGTRELQGLVVMMALLNNWDIKDDNNKILHVAGGEGRLGELRYIISDLGATFGKVKLDIPGLWRIARNRNEPRDYADDHFVEGVKDGRVLFFYKGKNQGLFDDIKVAEARWIGEWLSRLSDGQISDAFRAANYSPSEVRMLTRAVRTRINELVSLPAS